MHDHDDIDALALPARPPEDAPILVLLGYLARMWWRSSRWGWTTVLDTGITRYQVNGRGERRVNQRPGGYQPIDRHWLGTGEWAPRPSRVRALTALVNGATKEETAALAGAAVLRPPGVGPTCELRFALQASRHPLQRLPLHLPGRPGIRAAGPFQVDGP